MAGGLALGVFWSFIPLFILHIPLAFGSAQLLRVSRFAAVAGVFLANPVTIVPLVLAAWYTGRLLLQLAPSAPPAFATDESASGVLAFMESLTWTDIWAVLAGGVSLGLLVGAVTYRLVLRWMLRRMERRRHFSSSGRLKPVT